MEQRHSNLSNYFCLEDDMKSIEQFLNIGVKKRYKKGETIIPLGAEVEHLYYLKTGKVGRLITAVNGTEKFIRVVCDHSLFGEVLFFRSILNNKSAFIATEDCECYLFARDTVYDVLLKDECVMYDLIQWFCNRMRALDQQVEDSLLKDPYYRICKFLLDYTKEFGQPTTEGQYIYKGKLSHYDIAKYLGINRVSVTNIMKQLQQEEIIRKERSELVILDMDYLEEL